MKTLSKLFYFIVTAAIVTLFLKLSIWQWHRYQFKQALEQAYQLQWQAKPVNLAIALEKMDKTPHATGYYKVIANGHYDNQQFLLDNRTKNNQIGFDVITPFKLNNGQAILIDRGFIPANIHRQINTEITPPQNNIAISGLLNKPTKSFILGPVIEPEAIAHWPLRVMRLDPKSLSIPLNYSLSPYVILLDPTQAHGFLRQWSPPNLWAEKSIGYCFQWLAMALTVVIIYLIMICKKKEKKDVK